MKLPTTAPVYANLYAPLASAAREKGYALAIHGTMTRDFDVVAIPWTEDAADEQDLVRALLATIGFAIEDTSQVIGGPVPKLHGRSAWAIHLCGGVMLDLSVMPRAPTPDLAAQLREARGLLREAEPVLMDGDLTRAIRAFLGEGG